MKAKPPGRPAFSVVLPYYNEAAYLPATLTSWLGQTKRPDQMILINNHSTDHSETLCRDLLRDVTDIHIVHLKEDRPGKTHALETGCRHVKGTFVVFADADTLYPPTYLEICEDLWAQAPPDVVALTAMDVYGNPDAMASRIRRRGYLWLSKIWKKQTLSGGYAQVFRTDVLKKAGGFSEAAWPYVLLDHEIMHRILKHGSACYHFDLWCKPSTRRKDRRRVRWNFLERFLYHFTPYAMKDWYFYQFLGPRFEKRGLTHLNLREKTW